MKFDDQKVLLKEIETLTKDGERKARIILELYTLILKTENIDLIAEAGKATLISQVDEKLES